LQSVVSSTVLILMIKTVSDEIGTVAAQALVADTLTATFLSLEWEGSKHNGTLYRLQWQYAEVPDSTWQYCRNHTQLPQEDSIIYNHTLITR
jgi:hypothetical protein